MKRPNYNYKLTISYDGTNYCGWQVQPNGVTIQEKLQEALKIYLKKEIHIVGSGRTDSGVHALAQIANFWSEDEVDVFRLQGGLNGILPNDIRVGSIESAPINFHAQYSALGKIYHYHIHLDRVMDPFRRLYAWHLPVLMDLQVLAEAARLFVGTHDFSSFANESHRGSASHDPVRTMKRLDVVPVEGGIRLEFEADGFLYKMVRNIVGLLVKVGSKRRPIEDIEKLFQVQDRRLADIAAPPQGLFLVKVHY